MKVDGPSIQKGGCDRMTRRELAGWLFSLGVALVGMAIVAYLLWLLLYLFGLFTVLGGPKGLPVPKEVVTLRCTNGSPPRAWTKIDAEGALHYAQMSLEAARHYQVPALKQAYAAEAQAALDLVRICWR